MSELVAAIGPYGMFLAITGVLIPPALLFRLVKMSDQIASGPHKVLETMRKAYNGHLEAQLSVAWMYYKGWEVPRNWSASHDWYCKAAEQGSLEAEKMSKKLKNALGLS